MGIKIASLGSTFTYIIFTIFPVILFSTILVLKLRENYMQQIKHLHADGARYDRNLKTCLNESASKDNWSRILVSHKEQCRVTLAQVSETLEHLTVTLEHQIHRRMEAEGKTQMHLTKVAKLEMDLIARDNFTLRLKAENLILQGKIQSLNEQLSNVSITKQSLEDRLGMMEQDVSSLKTNTSRLEGEKKGLQHVLQVKTAIDVNKLEKVNKVIDLAAQNVLKIEKLPTPNAPSTAPELPTGINTDQANRPDSTPTETALRLLDSIPQSEAVSATTRKQHPQLSSQNSLTKQNGLLVSNRNLANTNQVLPNLLNNYLT